MKRFNTLQLAISRGILHCQNMDPVQNPGGGNNGGNPVQSDNPNNPQQGGQNNSGNNLPQTRSIWDTEPSSGPQGGNPAQNSPVQQPQPGTQRSPQEIMQEHIQGLNLLNGVDAQQVMQDMSENKPESFMQSLQTVAANAYQAAMMNMNKLVDQRVKDGMEQATQNSMSAVNKNMAIQSMNEKLSYTSDPDIAPVAEMVLLQLMEKHNKSLGDALKGVESFFKSAGEKINKDTPFVQRSNSPFSGSGMDNGNPASGELDWMDVLTGKADEQNQ